VELEPGKEYLFAVEYDGMTTVRFFVDGKYCGGSSFDGGPIVTPIKPLIIGDRFGSLQHRFNGQIKNVKLYSFPARTIKLIQNQRMAFTRGEDVRIGLGVKNLADKEATVKIETFLDGAPFNSPTLTIVPNKTASWTVGGGSRFTEVGEHELKAIARVIQYIDDGKTIPCTDAITDELTCKLVIGPMPPPDDFTVLVWNAGAKVPTIDTMVEYGITHDHAGVDKYGLDERDADIVRSEAFRMLDPYVANGVKHAGYFTFAHNRDCIKRYPRYNVNGVPVVKNIEASNPGYQEEARQVAAKAVRIIGEHPGFGAMLINSEVRDSSSPSFGKYEPKAFEEFAGYPIPSTVVVKGYDNYRNVSNFPLSRIIPDDDKILTYYRWFWNRGDGWNKVHSIVNEEFHKVIHGREFWTFFDPAVRTPPVWGSGGSVDVLNQWTYAYPDPIRIGVATDELFAMAKGRPGQKVMTMTQFICYRNQTAPIKEHPENEPDWVKDSPEGPFISIPPDSLKASIWTSISRPVQGIMFHGARSVWGQPGNSGYVTTNPKTKEMFKEVINGVVKPLGPTLKRVPDRPHEVAILESFSSYVYAQRGTWGWSGAWPADVHLMLQWAHLSPSIIYEEEIMRDGFGDLKVLCLVDCDVLTEGVFQKIQEFQAKGGIIIADTTVSPKIVPDISINKFARKGAPKEDKARLQELAAEVRAKLGAAYLPYADSDNADFVTRVRTYGDADYLFVINDKRDYGDYLGPWKRTMEKGLPNEGIVTLRRKNVKAVYDLVAHKPVSFKPTSDGIMIPQIFDSNGGHLLMVMNDKVEKVECKVTPSKDNNLKYGIMVRVLGGNGKPLSANVPINISIYDPDGKLLDGSGAACAVDGVFHHQILTTSARGKWTVVVTELASGKSTTVKFNQK
ncbi:MAG: hypothetical protein IJS15_10885, partial [Victivallales bacterium]|nr:hypothetical protein [Victivallales bacterium]